MLASCAWGVVYSLYMVAVQREAPASAAESPTLYRAWKNRSWTQGHGSHRLYRWLYPWLGGLLLVTLVGCGQVVTVKPTAHTEHTATIVLAVVNATDEPTGTPAPYTPAPTPTSTVTPTPVFHAIASGESLLSIANQYNVSVSSLQEA